MESMRNMKEIQITYNWRKKTQFSSLDEESTKQSIAPRVLLHI
jgi:hypothetical protein